MNLTRLALSYFAVLFLCVIGIPLGCCQLVTAADPHASHRLETLHGAVQTATVQVGHPDIVLVKGVFLIDDKWENRGFWSEGIRSIKIDGKTATAAELAKWLVNLRGPASMKVVVDHNSYRDADSAEFVTEKFNNLTKIEPRTVVTYTRISWPTIDGNMAIWDRPSDQKLPWKFIGYCTGPSCPSCGR